MEYSVSHSTFPLGQLLLGNGVCGKTSQFQGHELVLYFLCYGMNSLIRGNTIQNAMTVDKVFCESTVGGAGRSSIGRES